MNPKKTLHHYTNIESVISILENEELWLTNSRYTNDPTEFDFANSYVREAAKLAHQEILDDKHFEFKLNARTQKNYIDNDSETIKNIMSKLLGGEEFYIFSSTCHIDLYDEENGSLQMWRTYGNKKEDYNGCALVMDYKRLLEIANEFRNCGKAMTTLLDKIVRFYSAAPFLNYFHHAISCRSNTS